MHMFYAGTEQICSKGVTYSVFVNTKKLSETYLLMVMCFFPGKMCSKEQEIEH